MRSALAIVPLFALAHLGLATLDWNNIPNICHDQCISTGTLFANCARQAGVDVNVLGGVVDVGNGHVNVDIPGLGSLGNGGNGDNNIVKVSQQGYVDCACKAPNANTDIPNCFDCLVRNGFSDKSASDFSQYCQSTAGRAPQPGPQPGSQPGSQPGPQPGSTQSPTSNSATGSAAGSAFSSNPNATPTFSPTPTFNPTSTSSPTSTFNSSQPLQATGAASKLGGAQNVLVAAVLLGLPAVL